MSEWGCGGGVARGCVRQQKYGRTATRSGPQPSHGEQMSEQARKSVWARRPHCPDPVSSEISKTRQLRPPVAVRRFAFIAEYLASILSLASKKYQNPLIYIYMCITGDWVEQIISFRVESESSPLSRVRR